MRAMVYGGQGHRQFAEVPDPQITDDADVIVRVDTYSIPTLLRLVSSRQLDASKLVTHRFAFDDFDAAYAVFSYAADSGALKVVLSEASA